MWVVVCRWVLRLGLVGALVLPGCSPRAPGSGAATAVARPAGHPEIANQLERAAMRADLDFWLGTLEAVHPDPFAKVGRANFMAQFEDAKAALPTTQDPFAFYGTLQRLAALLHDSHTLAHYP